jgi:polygalacturonase
VHSAAAALGLGLVLVVAPSVRAMDDMGPPVVDVRAFGARGDGVSDDTDAIRAALRAVPAGGGTVIVPPGTYHLDLRGGARAMNLVGGHTAVIGSAGTSTLKLADASYAPHDGGMLLRNRDSVHGDAGIVVRGLTFDGNDRGNQGRHGRAESLFRCTRCRDLLVEDCTFVDAKYHGIATILGSDLVVRRNRFVRISQIESAGDAVQLNGPTGAVVSDNVVENTDEGIFCQHENDPATPARDCEIVRNRIQNLAAAAACTDAGVPYPCCTGRGTGRSTCTPDDPDACLCAAGASTGSGLGVLALGARVTDNVLVRVGQLSVQGLRAAGGFPTRDVLVAKNRLLDLAWNERLSGSGGIAIVAADTDVSRVTVRNNRVDHTRDAGIRLASARAALSEIEVGDNVVTASCTAESPCGGIQLATTEKDSAITRVTIARNAVGGSRASAIRLEGPAADIALVGNDTTVGANAGAALAVSERRGPVRYETGGDPIVLRPRAARPRSTRAIRGVQQTVAP